MKRVFRDIEGIIGTYEEGIATRCASFFGDGGDERTLAQALNHNLVGGPRWLCDTTETALRGGNEEADLLYDLAHPNEETPYRIFQLHLKDPRTRPALVEAVRSTALGHVHHLAEALSLTGGPGAVEVLRERLHEITNHINAMNFQPYGESTNALAEALLRLDPSAVDAAQALLRLWGHFHFLIRHHAVRGAADVFQHASRTEAMTLLRDAFEPLLQHHDVERFLLLAHILAHDHFDAVHLRCKGLLDDPNYKLRQGAAVALARVPAVHAAEAFTTLARWVPRGEPLGLALWVGSLVWSMLSVADATALVRWGLTAEPASTRRDALDLAGRFTPGLASVLEEALQDEPEPELQEKIRAQLGNT